MQGRRRISSFGLECRVFATLDLRPKFHQNPGGRQLTHFASIYYPSLSGVQGSTEPLLQVSCEIHQVLDGSFDKGGT